MKTASKTVFALYLLTLLWLVLFKSSFDLYGVLHDYQSRSISLIPFAGYSSGNVRQMIDNFVIFVPFGLFLGIIFKPATFLRKLACIFMFSFAVEITLGGLFGLAIYERGARHIDSKKLDWFILISSTVLLVALILWRVLFLRIKY